jgi:O-antigen/teichoic acid export membrane protein
MTGRTNTLPEYGDSISPTIAPALIPPPQLRFSAQARLLASQSLSAVIAQGLRMGIGLVIIPITLTYLGKERYGLWMLAMSTLSLIGLLDAGLAPTLKNKMAESFAHKNEDAFHYYASGGLLLGCVVVLIGLCLLPLLVLIDWSWVYGVAGKVPRAEAQGLTLACFAISLLSVALSFVEAMFAARMLLGTVYFYNSAASIAGLGAVLAVVHLHPGVAALAITVSAPQIIARLALLVSANRRGMIRFSAPIRSVHSLLRSVLPNSASFLGIKCLEAIIGAVPNLIASRFSGLSTVAILMVGLRVTTLPLTFVAAIVPVFWPAFTIAWTKGDLGRIRNQYVPLVAVTAVLLCLYACASVLIGPMALNLWLHGSLSVPRPILGVLGIWLVLQGVCHWVSTFLHSITDLNVQVICYAAQALITAALGALLCTAYGLLGLTISMTVALAMANLVPLGWRVYRKLSHTQQGRLLNMGRSAS